MSAADVGLVRLQHLSLEQLRAAIPPAENRADDVDADSQLELTLALLRRARERGRAA